MLQFGGGGPTDKMLQFLGEKFPAIFGFWVLDISRGQKTLFFKKCHNNGLVSEKKYIIFSR